MAHLGLAFSFGVAAYYGWTPAREAIPKCKKRVQTALRIDDSLPDAHRLLGQVLQWFDWDWATAEREFKKAIDLNSKNPLSHVYYSEFLSPMGRHEEAISEAEVAVALDPISLETNRQLGQALHFARHYDAAVQRYQETLNLDPNYMTGLLFLGMVYVAKHEYGKAVAMFQQGLNIDKGDRLGNAMLASTYAQMGRKEEARTILCQLEEKRKQEYVPATYISMVTASLGEKDLTFEWLERANEEKDPFVVFLNVHPAWDPVRDDPRFQDLLRRMNFPK